jgi:hypothetical protein
MSRRAVPTSTRLDDTPEFVERVQAESRRRLGGTIEEVARDPDLQEIVYNAIATSLREPPPRVSPDVAALVARLAEDGITLTPGSGDLRRLAKPMRIKGVSLSDAVIEERYGYR